MLKLSSFFHPGGPVVVEETNALGELPRFLLLGVVHGSFLKCTHNFPGMFIETDHVSVLEFLHREVYGSGLKYSHSICFECNVFKTLHLIVSANFFSRS